MQHEPAVLLLFHRSLHFPLASLPFSHCSRCIVPLLVRAKMADQPIEWRQLSRGEDQRWCFSLPFCSALAPPKCLFFTMNDSELNAWTEWGEKLSAKTCGASSVRSLHLPFITKGSWLTAKYWDLIEKDFDWSLKRSLLRDFRHKIPATRCSLMLLAFATLALLLVIVHQEKPAKRQLSLWSDSICIRWNKLVHLFTVYNYPESDFYALNPMRFIGFVTPY